MAEVTATRRNRRIRIGRSVVAVRTEGGGRRGILCTMVDGGLWVLNIFRNIIVRAVAAVMRWTLFSYSYYYVISRGVLCHIIIYGSDNEKKRESGIRSCSLISYIVTN